MPTLSLRRLLLLVALALSGAVGTAALSGVGPAGADVSSRIAAKQNRAERLRSALASETAKLRAGASGLSNAQARLGRLQSQTAERQAELEQSAAKLRKTRIRLTRLQNRLMRSFQALRSNLVEAYRNPQPDLIGVIIGAHDFADLIEKRNFYKRISNQNARIVRNARKMRVVVQRQTSELVVIQRRQRKLTDEIERKRDQAQTIQSALLRRRQEQLAGRASAAGELSAVNGQLSKLRRRLMRSAAPSGPNADLPTNAGGQAQAPAGAPAAVARVIAAGNAIAGLPYVYGGGHGSFRANAYDCSGSVSYALGAAGLVNAPMASGGFMSWGEPGPGKYITTYANAGHMFMVVGSWRFDTTALRQGGTRWTQSMRSTAGLVARHPPGL